MIRDANPSKFRPSYISRIFVGVLIGTLFYLTEAKNLIIFAFVYLSLNAVWIFLVEIKLRIIEEDWIGYLRILVDICFITVFVYATGIVISALTMCYLFSVVFSSLKENKNFGKLAFLSSFLAYILILVLTATMIFQPVNIFSDTVPVITVKNSIITGLLLLFGCYVTYKVVNSTSRKLIISRREAEKARREIEKLNEFSKRINETTNLDRILDEIFDYLNTTYNLEAVIVLLVGRDKEELYSYKTTAPENASLEMIDFSRGLHVPLNEKGGIIYRTYFRKRAFYLPKIDYAFAPGTDRYIIDRLGLRSFLLMPLVVQSEVIAMLMFTSYNKIMKLSKGDIASISRFCEQIAGAIYSSSLLKQVQKERAKSDKLLEDVLPEMAAAASSISAAQSAVRSLIDLEKRTLQNNCRLYLPAKSDDSFHAYNISPMDGGETPIPEKVEADKCRRLNALIGASLLEDGSLLIPIRSDVKLFAVLEIPDLYKPGEEPDQSSIRVMNSLANTLALKFENLDAEESKRLAGLGSMAATIVHDLKNPIGTIKGCAEMADDEDLDRDSRKEFLNIIQDEADRLSTLAHEILEFSRGAIDLHIEAVDAQKYMDSNLKSLAPLFEEDEIELSYQIDHDGVIHIDADRMRRVLLNLSTNAIDAMKNAGLEKPAFGIRLHSEDGFAVFTLADNGPGIPEEIRATLFEPFVTHGKSKGTGLGMAIVKKIVEEHGGTIRFETETGKGTTFFIELQV